MPLHHMRGGSDVRVRLNALTLSCPIGTLTCGVLTRRLQWQCYVPTLALLVTEDFGLDIVNVGYLYLSFVGTSIVASFCLNCHLERLHLTPYNLLMMGYAIRCISGLLHAIGCLAQGDGHTTFSFPLLCLSRILHGYTVLLFPLTVVWIGAREPSEQRAIALAQRNAFSTLGIFFGIVLGSLLASTTSSSLLAGMFPGWLNVIVSIVMLLWISAAFADREPYASATNSTRLSHRSRSPACSDLDTPRGGSL